MYNYERVVTPATGLRLHLNENTAGCSPAVHAALQGMNRHDAAFYPDYDAAIEACAVRLGVPPARVLLTNGLDEGILALTVSALRGTTAAEPFEVLVVVPAFDMYAACADAVGGRVIEVPLGKDFAFPLEQLLARIGPRTRLAWLTNPNNPTGQSIAREAILRVARAAPQALVVIDEAYADFSGETMLDGEALDSFENLVVGRTFAKAYGLAGLRAGVLVAQPGTLAPLRRIVPPYSINACAAAALPAALLDGGYHAWYLSQVSESKQLLYAAFERLGVTFWRSEANFVLARPSGDCAGVVRALRERGIHVRDKSRDPGCTNCIRVTAGVAEDTRTFIAALEEVLCDAA
jgi:histidinol-phosphate aminotransferase